MNSKARPTSGWNWRSWPLNHVVKCLAFYHPDDPPELRERQERQLLRLFDACRETGHELLLEIIAPTDCRSTTRRPRERSQRLYDIGIRPDWWKLEPSADAAAWANIVGVIEEHDPLCRGVVLLGLSAPIPDLIASFEAAAPFPHDQGLRGRPDDLPRRRQGLAGRIEVDDERSDRDDGSTAVGIGPGHGARHGPAV